MLYTIMGYERCHSCSDRIDRDHCYVCYYCEKYNATNNIGYYCGDCQEEHSQYAHRREWRSDTTSERADSDDEDNNKPNEKPKYERKYDLDSHEPIWIIFKEEHPGIRVYGYYTGIHTATNRLIEAIRKLQPGFEPKEANGYENKHGLRLAKLDSTCPLDNYVTACLSKEEEIKRLVEAQKQLREQQAVIEKQYADLVKITKK